MNDEMPTQERPDGSGSVSGESSPERESFPETLTIEEAAEYLRLGLRSVYNLANSGEIPAARIGGTWRFSKYTLSRWLGQKTMENLVRPTKQPDIVVPAPIAVSPENRGQIVFTWGKYGIQGLGVKSVKTAVDLRGSFDIDDAEGLFRFFFTSSKGTPWVQRALEVQSGGEPVDASVAAAVVGAVLGRIPEPRDCPQVGYVDRIVQRLKSKQEAGEAPEQQLVIDEPYNEPKRMKDGSLKLEGTFQLEGESADFVAHFKQTDGVSWSTKVIEADVSRFLDETAERGLEVTLMVLEAIYRDVPPIKIT